MDSSYYELLPGDERRKRAKDWTNLLINYLSWILHAGLFSVSIILYIKSRDLRRSALEIHRASDDNGFQRIYSPIWEAVQYERKIFYANQEDSAQFMGEPRQELDDAWANITNGHFILINQTGIEALGLTTKNATNVDGLYFAVPEYYHQMHCLDNIRKYLFRDSYENFAAFQGPQDQVWGHIDHCFDLLRQRIMCTADIGLIIYYWDGPEGEPKAHFATEHMCRNLDLIDDWVRKHAWEEEKPIKDLTYPNSTA